MLLLGLRLIRSLPLAHPYGASSMSLDSRRLHSRRERFSNRCALKLFANVRELELRLIDSNFPVLGFATSALLRLCRTASRWLHSLAPARSVAAATFVYVARFRRYWNKPRCKVRRWRRRGPL